MNGGEGESAKKASSPVATLKGSVGCRCRNGSGWSISRSWCIGERARMLAGAWLLVGLGGGDGGGDGE